ncbi:MAG TPA: phosphoenolpyruvate--protein phosphotransferase [Sedimentisphaerales bacterium]|nr:phosphoenolpyruvate--protein phosphotransferase [Sedimentisphaerales bacterium]
MEYNFTCPLPNGIHARPANNIEEIANEYSSDITLINLRNENTSNAKSVLSIVAADFKFNDQCRLIVSGPDQQAAFSRLKKFFIEKFADCDEPLPKIEAKVQLQLPPSLKAVCPKFFQGKAVVKGIAAGQVFMADVLKLPEYLDIEALSVEHEQKQIDNAIDLVKVEIHERMIYPNVSATEHAILKAHLSILRDVEFYNMLSGYISQGGCSAGASIIKTADHFTSVLKATQSLLLRERILDIHDISHQLLKRIYGSIVDSGALKLEVPSVCVADNLTPRQFLSLDKKLLKALVLTEAGETSHTVILARSLNIPTLVGVENIMPEIFDGQKVVVDGDLGIVVTNPDQKLERYYNQELNRIAQRNAKFAKYISKSAVTTDGIKIEIAANAASVYQVKNAFENGAQAIGLFRSEMLFMEADQLPDFSEQFEVYKEAAQTAEGKTVIIRTLDIGGDKPIKGISLPQETNPFLGYRAVRIYPEYIDIFRDQLKAIIRASHFGNIKLMVPMVSCLDEIRWVKQQISAIQSEFDKENLNYDKNMQVGIMVEVPSTAFIIDQLSREVDFFSIGTNDLLQYFIAADRGNSKISGLYNTHHPSFIRLLKKIVDDVHTNGKWVGMCGEMAGDSNNWPLLVGLGLDEISISSAKISQAKADIANYSYADCKKLLESALKCADIKQIDSLLSEFRKSHISFELLDDNSIIVDARCFSKEEAIKKLTDQLYITGRADSSQEIECAIWEREAVYSTGLGYGFAIPHCKSKKLLADSIMLLKLNEPIEWGSVDDKQVNIVIMLAIRDDADGGDVHMKIFAKLARKIMHEDFRQYLIDENDPGKILAFLKDSLELKANN